MAVCGLNRPRLPSVVCLAHLRTGRNLQRSRDMAANTQTNYSPFWKVQPYERPSQAEVLESQRRRLFLGLSRAVARKGYAAASVADVLSEVRISRRTFYELFRDKEDCFLAAYELAHSALVQHVHKAHQDQPDALSQLKAGNAADLHFIAAEPELAQAFMVGIRSAGPRALKRRAEAHAEFAAMHRGFHLRFRQQYPELPQLPDEVFLALVGGLNKMISAEIEAGRAAEVQRMAPAMLYMTLSVYGLSDLARECLAEAPNASSL